MTSEVTPIRPGRESAGEIIRIVARELRESGLVDRSKLPHADKGIEIGINKADHSLIKMRFVTQDNIEITWDIDCKKVVAKDGRQYLQHFMSDTLNNVMEFRARRELGLNIVFPTAPVADAVNKAVH